jgi:hypothetical protein
VTVLSGKYYALFNIVFNNFNPSNISLQWLCNVLNAKQQGYHYGLFSVVREISVMNRWVAKEYINFYILKHQNISYYPEINPYKDGKMIRFVKISAELH